MFQPSAAPPGSYLSGVCFSHLQHPLVKQRASDERHFEGDVAALLTLLAEMLVSGNPESTQPYACKVSLKAAGSPSFHTPYQEYQ